MPGGLEVLPQGVCLAVEGFLVCGIFVLSNANASQRIPSEGGRCRVQHVLLAEIFINLLIALLLPLIDLLLQLILTKSKEIR